ncbi:DUF1648 domain-containing protein [Streptomyces sp. NPDC051561]|uniref:DUF1648 domain-containing protein n=1 Tax=Streptomyces sp. NPDC051561 TaxID=3365658 RepID=UPI0037A95DFA
MTLHMNRGRLRLLALSVTPFALALLVHLSAFLAARSQLPDRLASRFGVSGEPVSFLSTSTAVLAGVALFVLCGALAATLTLKSARRGVRGMLAGIWGTAAFLGYLLPASTLAQRGVADGSDARFPLWHLAAAVVLALASAAVGLLLGRTVPEPPDPDGGVTRAGRIDLAEGEVASWSRRLGSGVFLLVAVAVLAAGAVNGALGMWSAGAPLLAVGLLALPLASTQVMVDRRGLTVAPALLHRPALRIPLGSIEAVATRDINPVGDYGGWGYRIRHGRSGLIVRSGEAIVVRRANGREFAVTVNDSATGAALLATLVERREARAGRDTRESR